MDLRKHSYVLLIIALSLKMLSSDQTIKSSNPFFRTYPVSGTRLSKTLSFFMPVPQLAITFLGTLRYVSLGNILKFALHFT